MTRVGETWTDEQISAFLDGELGAAEMDALGRAVEADASLAARVEKLGAANRAYVSAVATIDARPMSPAIAKILAEAPAAQTSGAKVLQFRPRPVLGSMSAWVMEHRALAASLICAAIVGGVASGLRTEPDPFAPRADGVIASNSALHRALENGATGEVVAIAANVSATPRLTFASDTGAFCRQFDVSTQRGLTSAIACRDGGTWRTEVAVFGKSGGTGDYQTASGAKSPALEAFIDSHISGAALNADEETKAMAQGWKASR